MRDHSTLLGESLYVRGLPSKERKRDKKREVPADDKDHQYNVIHACHLAHVGVPHRPQPRIERGANVVPQRACVWLEDMAAL